MRHLRLIATHFTDKIPLCGFSVCNIFYLFCLFIYENKLQIQETKS